MTIAPSTTLPATTILILISGCGFEFGCPQGWEIFIDGNTGQSHCLPAQDLCDAANCSPDETCYISGASGDVRCASTHEPCTAANCDPNETCFIDGNSGETLFF